MLGLARHHVLMLLDGILLLQRFILGRWQYKKVFNLNMCGGVWDWNYRKGLYSSEGMCWSM